MAEFRNPNQQSQGTGGGVKNWTAMDSMFAGGNAGIRALQELTGWKIVAHNRYWSANPDYAPQVCVAGESSANTDYATQVPAVG